MITTRVGVATGAPARGDIWIPSRACGRAIDSSIDGILSLGGDMSGQVVKAIGAIVGPAELVTACADGDAALDSKLRAASMPNSTLKGDANLLVMPDIDSANIAYNLLKTAAGNGIAIGPVLLGCARPVHILTPSATVRRIVNMTALCVVDAVSQR